MLGVRLLLITALFFSFSFPGSLFAKDFPAKPLQGVIMWGAGGAMDNVSRAITPNVEPHLDQEVILVNKPGGTGAIATQFVFSRRADGYTLLYGAENPQLYGVLGLSKLDYKDFYPVNILARGLTVVLVKDDSPWKSLQELVNDAKAKPSQLKMGTTGPGGVPFVVGKLIDTVTGIKTLSVPFKGEGPGITALLGGHVDFIPTGLAAASEHIRSGRVRALAVVDSDPLTLNDKVIPPITEDFDAFKKYVPWGPFYGVFCKNEVPDTTKEVLVNAFKKGADSERFNEFLKANELVLMNISGAEASEYVKKWQSITTWLLHSADATKVSPAEFGIPKP